MWTTELTFIFVPLPPEKEEAYWAAIVYFSEIMFAEENTKVLTVPAAELETVSQTEAVACSIDSIIAKNKGENEYGQFSE